MRLKTISYYEFKDQPYKWDIPSFELGSINLIVGKNASGKTRLLNATSGLARLLCSRIPISNIISTHYKAHFSHDDDHKTGLKVVYVLDIEDRKVSNESLTIDGTRYLQRTGYSEGTLFAQEIQQPLGFAIEGSQIAAQAKRDSKQHPYLEPLNIWARSTFHFRFGNEIAQRTVAV